MNVRTNLWHGEIERCSAELNSIRTGSIRGGPVRSDCVYLGVWAHGRSLGPGLLQADPDGSRPAKGRGTTGRHRGEVSL